jgi:hypothetical protein
MNCARPCVCEACYDLSERLRELADELPDPYAIQLERLADEVSEPRDEATTLGA